MTNQSLHFRIERYDDEDGVYFVASGREIALVTEGDTLEETLRNLREAVELYYEGDELLMLPRVNVATVFTSPEAKAICRKTKSTKGTG